MRHMNVWACDHLQRNVSLECGTHAQPPYLLHKPSSCGPCLAMRCCCFSLYSALPYLPPIYLYHEPIKQLRVLSLFPLSLALILPYRVALSPAANIFCGNMNPTSNKHDLEHIFTKHGKIVDIWVSLSRASINICFSWSGHATQTHSAIRLMHLP